MLAFNLIGDAMQDALNPPRPRAGRRLDRAEEDAAYQRPNPTERKDHATKARWLLAIGAVTALTFVLGACGGDDDTESATGGTGVPEEFAPPTAAPDGWRRAAS